MPDSRYADPPFEESEPIEWSPEAKYGSGFFIAGGLLVRTPRRVAFLPKRRPWLGSSRRWESRLDEMTRVRRIRRWQSPITGFLTDGRVLVESRKGNGLFLVAAPDAVLAALST